MIVSLFFQFSCPPLLPSCPSSYTLPAKSFPGGRPGGPTLLQHGKCRLLCIPYHTVMERGEQYIRRDKCRVASSGSLESDMLNAEGVGTCYSSRRCGFHNSTYRLFNYCTGRRRGQFIITLAYMNAFNGFIPHTPSSQTPLLPHPPHRYTHIG
jgi:hypothetical protein